MPLLLMLWCNVVKRNWTIILMQTVLIICMENTTHVYFPSALFNTILFPTTFSLPNILYICLSFLMPV